MIKLAQPYIPENAIEKISEVLRSGNLIQGKYVLEFEKELQHYFKCEHAILVSNGTAALHLSLFSLNIGIGDEVIVPAFTFPATANVVELVGAKPVFVDIKLNDYCINTDEIERAITRKTKAIIPVHEFGQAADIVKIKDIAQKHHLKIIEDAACALGTEYNGQKVGTFGELGCFSFHPRKAITTGEGGVIVTNDPDLAGKLRTLRNHGIIINNGKQDFITAGFNYRMTDFQAVLGLYQLLIIEELINQRIDTAKLYDELLKNIPWITTPPLFENRKMVYQTYHILLEERLNRDLLIQHLRNNGIETNYGAQALTELSYYKNKYSPIIENFIKAKQAYQCGLALPLGKHLNEGDIEYIVWALSEYEV